MFKHKVFEQPWETSKVGTSFKDLSFHMFSVDQRLHELEDRGRDVVRMTLGKSDRPLDKSVIGAMKKALDDQDEVLKVDSEGNFRTREAAANYYLERFKVEIAPKNIVIGSQGTSSIYRDLYQILLQSGGEVLLPNPGYILYRAAAMLARSLVGTDVKVRYYELDLRSNTIDLKSFRDNFDPDRNRIVVINSPGNPTGHLASEAEWRQILDVTNTGKRTVLFSDQIYANVVFGHRKYTSVLDAGLMELNERPLVVTDSLSKGFEMYTYRTGFAILPDELMDPLITFQRNFSLCPNTLSQFGAIEALKNHTSVDALTSLYESRYEEAARAFSGVRDVALVPCYGGFYFLLDCRRLIQRHRFENDLTLALDIMKRTYPHVGVTPGSDFGAANCLRVSLSPRGFSQGVKQLAGYFSKLTAAVANVPEEVLRSADTAR